ncbi:MAG: glycosyltransferase family 1 protein, partial [Saprospiraceae bacterium]
MQTLFEVEKQDAEKLKVLVIHDVAVDYLGDGILIGLINNPGVEVYQYPGKEILYKSNKGSEKIYGNGFTLYYLFENEFYRKANIDEDLIKGNNFDLIIITRIQVLYPVYAKYYSALKDQNVWILDGEDTPALYKYHGFFWRRPSLWLLPKAHTQFLYFKREWTPETMYYLYFKLIPRKWAARLRAPQKLRMISFTIPDSKILHTIPIKTKLFPTHIVDPEVASNLPKSSLAYPFVDEEDYYDDLRQ